MFSRNLIMAAKLAEMLFSQLGKNNYLFQGCFDEFYLSRSGHLILSPMYKVVPIHFIETHFLEFFNKNYNS